MNRINDKIATSFPGEAWTCLSADRVLKEEDAYAAPTELLQTVSTKSKPSGRAKMSFKGKKSLAGVTTGARDLVRA